MMSRRHMIVAVLALGMLGGACVEDVGSMLVVRSERLDVNACTFEPGIDGDFLARGTLDISLTNRYILFPTIQNHVLKPTRHWEGQTINPS